MQLDNYDLAILTALQQNARISNLELAETIGLSPTPTARRIKLLEQAGIIKRSTIVIDRELLGLKLTIFVAITLDRHTHQYFDDFEKAVQVFPEVINCSVVTGRAEDYLLEVVAKDMRHYEEFLLKRLNAIQGVSSVHTSFELKNVIHNAPIPLSTD